MSARRSGPVVFVAAAALPVVLRHRVIADIARTPVLGAPNGAFPYGKDTAARPAAARSHRSAAP